MVTEVDKRVNIRPVAEVVTLHLSHFGGYHLKVIINTCITASVKENPLACILYVYKFQHY